MESTDEVYKGYLLLPAKALIKNKWQHKYCYLYKASKSGIARLEVWDTPDNTKGPPFRIITLENCITIGPIDSTHIRVITKTASHEFGTVNEGDLNVWVAALQSVAFPDDRSIMTSIEEDNDLYCSSGEGVFNVRIHPSPASERCGLDTKIVYILLLGSTSMKLKTVDGNTLFKWPYCFIRRYGYKHGKFTFEAGRKCESGEGVFYLEHSNQQEIFRCVSSKMKSMKKLMEIEPTSAILDCGDNQFHAALTMEARSRSPLPPSPTSSTTIHDIENSSMSSQGSITESLKNVLKTTSRPVPVKPPRKSIPPSSFDKFKSTECLTDETTHNSRAKCEVPSTETTTDGAKYTSIEFRTEAWKTLGVGDVTHTESVVSAAADSSEELYFSWGDPRTLNKNVSQAPSKAPAVLISPGGGNEDYDKLDYFGSSSKLNVSSTYKQIAVSQGAAMPCPPSFNDYDEVQPVGKVEIIPSNIEKRLADDSHLGYAQIKKNVIKLKKNENSGINHHLHNDTQYAVISKPKRV